MENHKIVERLLKEQRQYSKTLILNPTENIPLSSNIQLNFTENLYIPEEPRTPEDKIIFAGRDPFASEYQNWCQLLHASDASFKPNSGLGAHILLFMSIADIGSKVLLLPEKAGGHFSTKKILERLGLEIKEFAVEMVSMKIDREKSQIILNEWKPDYIFIDRSEGLYYEDFQWLGQYKNIYKIFDASQYLSNIMAGTYTNPFSMGFDLILSTLHKNYPGPQKAAFFTRNNDELWERLKKGLRTYVSSIHPKDIYQAIITLPSKTYLEWYSKTMLECTYCLDSALQNLDIPIVRRDFSLPFTQQIWITLNSANDSYFLFKCLEELGIYTNYRLLPYNLGYGLRLGTAAAVRQGLCPEDCTDIASIFAEIWKTQRITSRILKITNNIIDKIHKRGNIFDEVCQ